MKRQIKKRRAGKVGQAGRAGKTVMVFGTFDLVHPGHLNFLKQAKKLGGKLVVSIARDINVKKIKGAAAWNSEKKRLLEVKKLEIADKVILGGKNNYLQHIIRVAPDIIALGYDQNAYTENLRRDLRGAKLKTEIIRLQAHRPHLYKSSKLKAAALNSKMLKSKQHADRN